MGDYGDVFSSLVAGELRAERARKKLTIESLVVLTGLSKSAILNYLNGKRDIPTSALVELSQAMGIEPAEIFARAEHAIRPEDYALAASDADYDDEAEAGMEFP
ncbi:helix-turn-helix transcriptional regulator [Timonella senegalensis]|uniref:helix-turn-helix domain-containing protein n=1 Tax=Timonella senegalensis TaxID=1465825 RepID=UPI002FDD42FD